MKCLNTTIPSLTKPSWGSHIITDYQCVYAPEQFEILKKWYVREQQKRGIKINLIEINNCAIRKKTIKENSNTKLIVSNL